MTEADQNVYYRAIEQLEFPTKNNDRVRLNRIVQKSGSRGGLRGTLGYWIVPLTDLEDSLREELIHDEFPHKFPESTTGMQALDFLLSVWNRARLSPSRLAADVRDILPMAYVYLLQDLEKDSELAINWQNGKQNARVFVDGEWVYLVESANVYFNDIEDQRFFSETIEF